jgi:hypothetical protein
MADSVFELAERNSETATIPAIKLSNASAGAIYQVFLVPTHPVSFQRESRHTNC